MKKNTLCTLAIAILSLALSVPLVAQSGGVEFSGDIKTLWGLSTPFASGSSWSDSDVAGRFTLGDTSFTGTLDAYYGNSSAYAQGSVGYDATSNNFYWNLDELYLDYSSSFWGVRIGRQKAAWGKADGIDITNVICPTDMSSFSAITSDDSSLAVDAVRLSFSGASFTADAFWIPFFTPSALPLGSENPLRKFLVPSSVEMNMGGPALSLPVTLNDFEKPELAIWNGEYAVKLSGYFSALDISLYGFYGWDDLPLLDYTLTYDATMPTMPAGITVDGAYKHMGMIGADAAIPLGETVIRAEAAFFPQRSFQKSAEAIIKEKTEAAQKALLTGTAPEATTGFERRNQISALCGIDWMPSGWTLTAQYFCDYVFGDIESLERENAYEHGATLSVSKTLLDDTLELSLAGIINFPNLDSLISPSVTYSLSDQIKLGGGAYIFIPGPEKDGTYGAYKDLSTVYVKASLSF